MIGRVTPRTHRVYTDAFRAKITGLQVFIVITRVETALAHPFQYIFDLLRLLFNGSR